MAKRKLPPLNRVYCFFALFCFVYFLESIGGIYMVSAVQSIEKQFQIPSKMSGLMISAGDFGYIPTVIVISYMGSKGNRARWIGGGCLLIAFANLMIATPNFLFAAPDPALNKSVVQNKLRPPFELTFGNVTPEQLLDYGPIKERLPASARKQLLENLRGKQTNTFDMLIDYLFGDVVAETTIESVRMKRNPADPTSSVDPDMADMKKAKELVMGVLMDGKNATDFFDHLKDFLRRKYHDGASDEMVKMVTRMSAAPFGMCNRVVNELRQLMEDIKCSQSYTNAGPFTIVFIALFFLGIGRTMPWSLGVPLIDDNVKRKNLPLYFAGMFFIRILGPILGFGIGSICNRLYVNFNPPEGLSPRDPAWIGAWWLGFLFISIILSGPSLALFLFPNPAASKDEDADEMADEEENTVALGEKGNRAPKRKRNRSLALVDRHARKSEDGQTIVPLSLCEKAKDFGESIVEVLKSRIYSGALVGRILDVMAFKGFMVFLPKYLENHYGIPQYKVQMYMGMFGVVGFAVGMLTGSFVMRRFKLEGRRAALFVAVCSACAVFLFFCKIFLPCNSIVNSVGVQGKPFNYNYTTSCNADCFCDPVKLFPVCDMDGNPYYSPCHAGCSAINVTDMTKFQMEFVDCKCVPLSEKKVQRDWCKDDCGNMIVAYFTLVIIAGITGGMSVIPGVLIILRAVPPAHRSISLGFSGFLVSLFATLPSPVIWGFIIDWSCLVWEKTCTGTSGNCTIYDPNSLRNSIHIFYGLLRGFALLSDVWVWYYAKGLKLMSDEDDEKETEDSKVGNGATFTNGKGTLALEKAAGYLAVSQENLERKLTM